jgi:hypothetical protein
VKTTVWICLVFLAAVSASECATLALGAASQVTRDSPPLKPSALKQLSRSIVRKLEAQGCTIPQVDDPAVGPIQTNVIHGEFARIGQVDWAVLCARDGRSTILVFWGGSTSCPGEIHDPLADRHPPGAGIEWSADRYIGAVTEGDLRGISGPPDPGVMKHQGIADLMDSKMGTVYYCSEGQWRIVARAWS